MGCSSGPWSAVPWSAAGSQDNATPEDRISPLCSDWAMVIAEVAPLQRLALVSFLNQTVSTHEQHDASLANAIKQ